MIGSGSHSMRKPQSKKGSVSDTSHLDNSGAKENDTFGGSKKDSVLDTTCQRKRDLKSNTLHRKRPSPVDEDTIAASKARPLQAVVVIPPAIAKTRLLASAVSSPHESLFSTLASTPRDGSEDYETPGTTPATSLAGTTMPKRKRKRSTLGKTVLQIGDSAKEDESDAALAMRLQNEEYAQEHRPPVKRVRASGVAVRDSEDACEQSDDYESSDSMTEFSRPAGYSKSRHTGLSPKLTTKNGKGPALGGRPAASGTRRDLLRRESGRRESGRRESGRRESARRESAESTWDAEIDESEEGSDISEHSEFDVDTAPAHSHDSAHLSEDSEGGRQLDGRHSPSTSNNASPPPARYRVVRRPLRRRHRIPREESDHGFGGDLTRKQRERIKLVRSHPVITTMWTTLEATPVITPVAAEQPPHINRALKPFQLEGLDWMVKQEKTQYKGGLLGDEMGMGKTIQAVSLIMSDFPQKAPSLVVVPPVALMQWSSEIAEYTDGKLNVLIYHGQNSKVKGMTVKDLCKFDVIMISYHSLESLHRKETKGWKRGEEMVKEASRIHAIDFHRLILDEAHSIKERSTGVAKACFALKGTYKW